MDWISLQNFTSKSGSVEIDHGTRAGIVVRGDQLNRSSNYSKQLTRSRCWLWIGKPPTSQVVLLTLGWAETAWGDFPCCRLFPTPMHDETKGSLNSAKWCHQVWVTVFFLPTNRARQLTAVLPTLLLAPPATAKAHWQLGIGWRVVQVNKSALVQKTILNSFTIDSRLRSGTMA